ncbi:hypothetical protein X802_04480 [Thermococcus guaymasensis DSM 11113]|uniref:Uncharacterized protein n=2 Tax=Thermococcus guaymasensis TaxID=110164 RepID=A0A0X1KNA1_9EURY|nr:hypothetical protein X802_04480 [Thermococcus guaymasensis DSM 11113]
MRWKPLFAVLLGLAIVLVTPAVSASHEIVSSDYSYGENRVMKLSGALYKDTGELDPNYDYYAVKITTEDAKYRNSGWVGPMYIYVDVAVLPSSAAEVPASHVPTSGTKFTQHSVSFSYEGIGFDVQIPRTFVSYWEKNDWAHHFVWEVSGIKPSFVGWWFVFDDYAEFATGFRVPQSSNVFTAAYAYGEWYKLYLVVFRKIASDYAVIGMSYLPKKYSTYYKVNELKHQICTYNRNIRNIQGLPEMIKVSPETQSLAGVQKG